MQMDLFDMSSDVFRIIPLFSGSSGNAVFISFAGTKILIDAGRSCKQIIDALGQVGESAERLDAIFITHDHSDHLSGLDVLVRKYNHHTYATAMTWRGIRNAQKKPHAEELDHVIEPWKKLKVGCVDVTPFPTPHDAKGSVGYRFESKGRSFALVTDIGHFSEDVKRAVTGTEAVLIEANYNKDMLFSGPYPWILKKRVDSDYGHLCNADCAKAVAYLLENGTQHIILGHLSQENNSPSVARREVMDYLLEKGFLNAPPFSLTLANRHYPSPPIVLGQANFQTTTLSPSIAPCRIISEARSET